LGAFKNINDENLISTINEKIKLCNKQKLRLLDHFLEWLIDEKM
jgi:hypothetical protein